MRTISLFKTVVVLAGAVGLASFTSSITAADPDTQQTASITDSAKAFVEAFHKGDAKAVAAFWMPDGDYVTEHGHIFQGRKAIENMYAELFAENKGLKLRIDIASIRFPTPDVAIEDGTASVMTADGSAPSRSRYNNVLIKKDGKWLLSSVREAAYTDPSNHQFLGALDWMIGDWADATKDGNSPVGHVAFEWAPTENFIVATRTAEFTDAVLDNGMQMIGWDPVAKQIRSWSFESDGGYGESSWTKDGSKWVVKTKATTADGTAVTATNIITPVDANTVSWISKDRTAGGKPLPDSKEVTMKRIGSFPLNGKSVSSAQTN